MMDSEEYDQLDSDAAIEMDADPTANDIEQPSKSAEDYFDANLTTNEIMQNEVIPQLSASGELAYSCRQVLFPTN